MTITQLQEAVERCAAEGPDAFGDRAAMDVFLELRAALEKGEARAASPDPASPTGWRVNFWVKKGILLGFKLGVLTDSAATPLSFVDKHTFPPRLFTAANGIRLIPGGSAVRAGAYVARGVICVPPMYINTGAWVDEATLVDSHALVGSCAQIGGVLEPVNASPVVIEDDVLVGGNAGVYEGTIVRKGAVLAAGTILTRGTPLFDLPNGSILRATADVPLIVPENAVVVPGSRAVTKAKGEEWGLSLYAPIIAKYRDAKTDISAALEDLIR